MSFFKSEVVRAEMVKISELQEKVYANIFKFPSMSKEEKIRHVELLEDLIDKQKVLFARLSLSDDPEAVIMKERIIQSAVNMGMHPNANMNMVLSDMEKTLEVMKERIDKYDKD